MQTPNLLLISVFLAACGSEPTETPAQSASNACSGLSILGTWQGQTVPSDVLNLGADCNGSSSYCQATFSFKPKNADGTIDIDVHQTNVNAFCFPSAGQYRCAINDLDPNVLTLDCGPGAVTWTR